MISDSILSQLVSVFLILLFGIKLLDKKSFQNAETKYFWLTLVSCLLLSFQDVLELMTAEDTALRFWRVFLSVIGYTLRSTASLGLLFVVLPREKRSFLWWIPALITMLVNCTAFFSDVAFGYDEGYAFYRGPLGIV